jgi:hypothetical protein
MDMCHFTEKRQPISIALHRDEGGIMAQLCRGALVRSYAYVPKDYS